MFKLVLFFGLLLSTQALEGWAPGSEDCERRILGSDYCLSCFNGFALNEGKCEVVYESNFEFIMAFLRCSKWNRTTSLCEKCFNQRVLVHGKCEKQALTLDPNCAQFLGNTCKKCAFMTVMKGGVCTQMNSMCKKHDNVTFLCTECYDGYSLNSDNTNCVEKTHPNLREEKMDMGCKVFKDGKCMECAPMYTKVDDVCTAMDDMCKEFNDDKTLCTKCYDGYTVNAGKCVEGGSDFKSTEDIDNEANYKNMDVNCRLFEKGKCKECAYMHEMVGDKCTEVSADCKTHNKTTALCLTCYMGYTLSAGKCLNGSTQHEPTEDIDNEANYKNMDVNCRLFEKGKCKECAYMHEMVGDKCTEVSADCKTHNKTTALCLTCYMGYTLSAGKCLNGSTQHEPTEDIDNEANYKNMDVNCRLFEKGKCKECAYMHEMVGDKCTEVSADCKTHNKTTALCLTCYMGYTLSAGKCLNGSTQHEPTEDIDNEANYKNMDVNCRLFEKGKCKECAYMHEMVGDKCTEVSADCKTHNKTTALCLTCYMGYTLSAGKCLNGSTQYEPTEDIDEIKNDEQPCIEYEVEYECEKWDQDTGYCFTCIDGYHQDGGKCYPTENSGSTDQTNKEEQQCVQYTVQDECETWDQETGDCFTCIEGSHLDGVKCSQIENSGSNPIIWEMDPGCSRYENGKCAKCSYWYAMVKGRCTMVSNMCKTYDEETALCTSCYDGYSIDKGICGMGTTQPQLPSKKRDTLQNSKDENCLSFKEGKCVECIDMHFVVKDKCTMVSILCKTYSEETALCTSCYDGYSIDKGICSMGTTQPLNPSGSTDKEEGRCVQYTVQDECETWDQETGDCFTCIEGYYQESGKCIILGPQQEPDKTNIGMDMGCGEFKNGKCMKCSYMYFMIDNVCVEADPMCAKFDLVNHKCSQCYVGYTFNQGKCTL